MDKIRAKLNCYSVVTNGEGEYKSEQINLRAVYDGSDENKSFSLATPYAELGMTISNPSAHGFFEQGKDYYLDFTKA